MVGVPLVYDRVQRVRLAPLRVGVATLCSARQMCSIICAAKEPHQPAWWEIEVIAATRAEHGFRCCQAPRVAWSFARRVSVY